MSPDVEHGDGVRCRPRYTYNDYTEYERADGYIYGLVKRSVPDNDNDIKVHLLDKRGEKSGVGYFDADRLEKHSTPDEPSEPDEPLNERLEAKERGDDGSLAVLQEEQENLVQMQEMRARTVDHGVLELDVNVVTSAKNSQQWAIKVDHPILDELTFYVKKPVMGWSDEYRVVELLAEYGIHDGNPYKLQQQTVYVEHIGGDPEQSQAWKLRTPSEIDHESVSAIGSSSADDGPDADADGFFSHLVGFLSRGV